MAVLDQIGQMKRSGMSDSQIIERLQGEGISPKVIQDSLAQYQVKSAVEGEMGEAPAPAGFAPEPAQDIYTPAPQAYVPQEMPQPSFTPQPQYAQPEENYYPQEGYQDNSAQGASTDTVIEVAEQVFEEKIKRVEDSLSGLREFSTLSGNKLVSVEERLSRIEGTIDKLQFAILEKIGSYGENLESIKKEMGMMQDSFSKTLPSMVKKTSKKK